MIKYAQGFQYFTRDTSESEDIKKEVESILRKSEMEYGIPINIEGTWYTLEEQESGFVVALVEVPRVMMEKSRKLGAIVKDRTDGILDPKRRWISPEDRIFMVDSEGKEVEVKKEVVVTPNFGGASSFTYNIGMSDVNIKVLQPNAKRKVQRSFRVRISNPMYSFEVTLSEEYIIDKLEVKRLDYYGTCNLVRGLFIDMAGLCDMELNRPEPFNSELDTLNAEGVRDLEV